MTNVARTGVYVETDSSGAVLSRGTYRIADTAGSQEGFVTENFAGASIFPTCATATDREVEVFATLIDASTGAMQTVAIGAHTDAQDPTQNDGEVDTYNAPYDAFAGPVPGTAITCWRAATPQAPTGAEGGGPTGPPPSAASAAASAAAPRPGPPPHGLSDGRTEAPPLHADINTGGHARAALARGRAINGILLAAPVC